jgi:hypothetical protein
MFSFLEQCKLREELFEGNGVKTVMKYPHHFYTPYPEDLPKALETFVPFPAELKAFYEQVGFGFMHRRKGKINRLLDPVSLILVNLRLDECRYDKTLERTLAYYDINRQLLFFQLDNGEYLAINRMETNGCNPIFYKEQKLSDSLLRLLTDYDKNRDYLPSTVKYIDDSANSPMTVTSKEENASTTENAQQAKTESVSKWSTLIDDDDMIIQ